MPFEKGRAFTFSNGTLIKNHFFFVFPIDKIFFFDYNYTKAYQDILMIKTVLT